MTKSDAEREKGGSHDPQVPDDCCDRCYRARPLDWRWSCPGPRLWRRVPRQRVRGPRFLWRLWPRFLRRIRARFRRRVWPQHLRRVWRLLSGLLWVWLFPVLLLLLLIGYSCRRERRSSARNQSSAGWAELWIFNALHFHPPVGVEYLSASMPAYPESASLELPFKLAKNNITGGGGLLRAKATLSRLTLNGGDPCSLR